MTGKDGKMARMNNLPSRESTVEQVVLVDDDGATITVRGLPNPRGGVYGVWLYDSVVRAKSLGTLPDGSGKLEVALPPDARSYRFLDDWTAFGAATSSDPSLPPKADVVSSTTLSRAIRLSSANSPGV